MKINQVIILSIILVVSVSIFNHATAGDVSDELVPANDFFSSVNSPDPYYIALRELLIGEHRYRKCQIVAIPAFEREWAAYLIRENGKSQLFVKIMKKQLWTEMMREISNDGKKQSYSVGTKSQEVALSKLPKQVESHSFYISEETADTMEKAWEAILARVRYTNAAKIGYDGISYHISHRIKNGGSRSGTTWSPREGTFPADLVAIGYLIKDIAGLSEEERKSKEEDIKHLAGQLIEKIGRSNPEGKKSY